MAEISRLSYRHDAIMEWLIANPDKSLHECALTFGFTQAWLSTIIHSDVFRAKYAALLANRIDERIMPLRDKLVGITNRALDAIGDRLETPEIIETQDLKEVATMGLRGLGYGGSRPATPPVNINIHSSVTVEELRSARERYKQVAGASSPVTIEGTAARESNEPAPSNV